MLESATPSPAETEPIGITKPAKGRPEHPSREVFERRRWGDQIGGSIGLLVGSLLLLASMFTAWWTLSITDGGSAETISFFPGASYVTTGSPETGLFFGAPTYSASGLNQLGVLYGHILSAGIFVIVIAFVAALIGFLSLRSVRPASIAPSFSWRAAAQPPWRSWYPSWSPGFTSMRLPRMSMGRSLALPHRARARRSGGAKRPTERPGPGGLGWDGSWRL
jgi:hypothetical protein